MKQKIFILLGILILGSLLYLLLYTGSIVTTLGNDSISVNATGGPGEKLRYSDIQKIELVNDLEVGKRTGGIGNNKIEAGSFSNASFGDYSLYSYTATKNYIVIHFKDKRNKRVINAETPEKTKLLYNEVLKRITKP